MSISESLIGQPNKENKMQISGRPISNTTLDNYKTRMLSYLCKKAESDRDKALGSLSLLLDNGVGIGDHSTGDYHKNLDEALDLLVDARDRLETLQEHFG